MEDRLFVKCKSTNNNRKIKLFVHFLISLVSLDNLSPCAKFYSAQAVRLIVEYLGEP